jgi:hypothetical protein
MTPPYRRRSVRAAKSRMRAAGPDAGDARASARQSVNQALSKSHKRDSGFATPTIAAIAAALSLPLAAALALTVAEVRSSARAESLAQIDARLDGAIELAVAALMASGPSPAATENAAAGAQPITIWITSETDKIDIASAPDSFIRREIERLVANAAEDEAAQAAIANMRETAGRVFPETRAIAAPQLVRCFGRIFGAGAKGLVARGATAELLTDGQSPPVLIRGYLPERPIGARFTITAETRISSNMIAGAERSVILVGAPEAPAWIVDARRFRSEEQGSCFAEQ